MVTFLASPFLWFFVIVALQCCVSFCYTTKWISYTYTYIPPSWASSLPLTPPPSYPSRSSLVIWLCKRGWLSKFPSINFCLFVFFVPLKKPRYNFFSYVKAQSPFRSFVVEKHVCDFAPSGSSKRKHSQLPSYFHIRHDELAAFRSEEQSPWRETFSCIGNRQKGEAGN